MTYIPRNPNGQANMANSEPVVIASDQSAIPVTDNGASLTVDGTVAVSNFPATQPVSGTVAVSNFPTNQTVSGTVTANAGTGTMNVSVQNASIPVTDNGGSLTVDGSVAVSNFPATQAVSGTVTANAGTGTMNVSVQNASIPVTDNGGSLTVDGTVAVSNFPATQPVSGTVDVGNFPATQVVSGTVTANAGTGTMNVSVQNASIPVTDNGSSLTVDSTQLPSALGSNGAMKMEGCTAHDAVDAGAPVKIGYHVKSTTLTSLANGDRSNAMSDRFGRGLTAHIDPGMQVWKQGEYATAQTGTNIWVPTTGNRFVITQLHITTAGTTAGLVTIWGAATGTTAYVAGTDQVFFRGNFIPSATGTPGALIQPPFPLFSDTTNDCLKITTSAAMTVYIQVYGYEITP
jgi:hypothetical protein